MAGVEMKIDVVCYDLSNNAFGRAYLLADLLRRSGHNVRIAGLQSGETVWPPLSGGEIATVGVRTGWKYPSVLKGLRKLVGLLDCEVVLASKPKVSSFGAALLKRLGSGPGKRLLLDIDDWEGGYERPITLRKLFGGMPGLVDIDSLHGLLFMERLTALADGITVSSTFLQRRFGGSLLPHVRDTDFLDPARYDRDSLRARFGITDEFVVAFLGTIRPHKGIELILGALPRLESIKARLLLIGTGVVEPQIRRALDQKREYLIEHPDIPFRRLPEFYAISDLVVLPQMRTPFGMAQLPMKLLDSMSMAKPIISTSVSDIPDILDGCGIILAQENEDALVGSIISLHDDPPRMRSLGESARKKCVEKYSYRQGMPVLERLLNAS